MNITKWATTLISVGMIGGYIAYTTSDSSLADGQIDIHMTLKKKIPSNENRVQIAATTSHITAKPNTIHSEPSAEDDPYIEEDISNTLSVEDLSQRLVNIQNQIPAMIQANDGNGLVKLLRQLKKLGPKAYPHMVDIVTAFHKDLSGPNKLNIKSYKIYTNLSNGLFKWALNENNFNNVSVGFRLHAYKAMSMTENYGHTALLTQAYLKERSKASLDEIAKLIRKRPNKATAQALLNTLNDNTELTPKRKKSIETLMYTMPGNEIDIYIKEKLRTAETVNSKRSLAYSLNLRKPQASGYLVRSSSKDYQTAGLQPGDIITRFGDQAIDKTSLDKAFRAHKKKEKSSPTVTITYIRDGQTHTAQVNNGKLNIKGHQVSKNKNTYLNSSASLQKAKKRKKSQENNTP